MGFVSQIAKILLTFYAAKSISNTILTNNYYLGVVLLLVFAYFFLLPWNQKFIIFSIMIFFNLIFPGYFPLPMNNLFEIVAPVLCFLLLIEILGKGQPLFSKEASLHLTAIGVLGLWSIVHYIKNPVLGQITFGVGLKQGGLQSYYVLLVGITTFLSGYWFFKYKELNLNIERCLFILLIFTLIVGNLQLIAFSKNISVPFLKLHGLYGKSVYSSHVLRGMAALGIPIVLSLIHYKGWRIHFTLIFIYMFIFIIFGGGRANFLALTFTIAVYFIIFKRKHLLPALLVLLILVSVYAMGFSDISFSESKFGRTLRMHGGLKEQSIDRYYLYKVMWEVFITNPVFGKGIGYQQASVDEKLFQEYKGLKWKETPGVYVSEELLALGLMSGSHGAYMSVLSLFGIGGLFWIIVMLFGSIFYSYKIFKTGGDIQRSYKLLSLFTFLYLVRLSIGFTSGMEGYTNIDLWFIAGIVTGLRDKVQV